MRTRRLFLSLGLVVALVLVASVALLAQEPKSGGDLTIVMDGTGEPSIFDAQMDPYVDAWLISHLIADNLAFRDYDGLVKPHLASWAVSEDGLTWIFLIRKGVTFHDGTSLNAEVVKANFERVLDPERPTPQTSVRLGPITSVKVLDEYVLKITFSDLWAAFPDSLSLGVFPIWSSTALDKYGDEGFPEKLVGSGPFMLDEWVPGSHVRLVKNADYNWAPAAIEHSGPAYLDSVTFKWVTEKGVRGQIMKTGDVNMVMELPAEYVDTYKDDPSYIFLKTVSPGTGMQFVMNTTDKSPLDDIRVRRAVLYTIDQKEINDLAYGGNWVPSYGAVNPRTPSYNPEASVTAMYPHNLDKARDLLSEAGWVDIDSDGIREKNGEELKLGWYCIHNEIIGEVVAEQLKEIGVRINVQLVPGPVQLEAAQKKTFDFMYERERGPDIGYLWLFWYSGNAEPGGWAWTGFADPELDHWLETIKSSANEGVRFAASAEVQRIILENALQVPTVAQPIFWVLQPEVKNFRPTVAGNYFHLYDVWLD